MRPGRREHDVHDYYRIADVWDGSRRASQVHVRAPWWRTLPGAPAASGRMRPGGRTRVLDPDAPLPVVWRDDVALDFPSAHGPAERMRRAFLAQDEPAARCVVGIEVLRRRTVRACRVPVQVVVPSLCTHCGGRGEAWGDPCAPCDGTGLADERRYVVLRVPAGVRDGARFCYRLEVPHASPLLLDVRVTVR
jgi:hypothetical protein